MNYFKAGEENAVRRDIHTINKEKKKQKEKVTTTILILL